MSNAVLIAAHDKPDSTKSAIRLVVKQRSANDVQDGVKFGVIQILSTTFGVVSGD